MSKWAPPGRAAARRCVRGTTRLVYPPSGSYLTGRNVRFRWVLPDGLDSVRVDVCRTASCPTAQTVTQVVTGAEVTLPVESGFGYWRLRSSDGATVLSPTWFFVARGTTAVARARVWPGVLMIKGVNRPDDALRAVEHGCDGIIVSNHGGRNMDSAVATIDVLPDVAEAVGDKATVLIDSGVRRGSDIAKALALGAKAVLTGRATLYGTSVGGQAGAAKAIGVIRKEFDNTMVYTGCNSVDEITPDILYASRDTNSARGFVG